MAQPPLPAPFGPYILEAAAGHGGMGTVFRARHAELRRTVALKILRPDVRLDVRTEVRFAREARAGALVDHPAFVEVYDYGVVGDMHYLAMEWIEGPTLAQRISDGPLPVAEALVVARTLLDGLAACHAAGFVHRDLKPLNLMLEADGRLRILDLGLAREHGRTALTKTGEMIGTPRYIPPEVFRSDPVDARSDIHQVGTILHEMLGGRPAFPQTTVDALIRAVLDEPLPRLPDLGPLTPGLQALLDRMCDKDPAQRYPDARAALGALESAAAGTLAVTPVSVHAPASGPRAAALTAPISVPPERPLGVAIVITGLLIAGVVALVHVWPARRSRPAPSPAAVARAAMAPRDLAVLVGANAVEATFATEAPAIGVVTIPGSALASREGGPATSHLLRITGLTPDADVAVEAAVEGAASTLRWRGRTLSTAVLAKAYIDWVSITVEARKAVASAYRSGSQATARELLERAGRPMRGTAGRWLCRAVEEAWPLILRPDQLTTELRSHLLRRGTELDQLHVYAREALGRDPGWRAAALPGLSPDARAPAGLRVLAAIKTPVFLMSGEESGLQLKLGVENVVVVRNALPAVPPREAYLSYRVRGGTPYERLAVVCNPGGTARKQGEIAYVPSQARAGRVEGAMRIDERLLVMGNDLRVSVDYEGPLSRSQGITVERLEILAP